MHALIAIALALAVAVGFVPPARAAPGAKTEALAFYVNYAARVPTAPLVAHALSIVHPDAAVDLAAAHRVGNTVLAYLSVGEVAADAPYRADVLARRLPFAGRNATWNSPDHANAHHRPSLPPPFLHQRTRPPPPPSRCSSSWRPRTRATRRGGWPTWRVVR